MRFFAIRPEIQVRLAVFVPLVALLLSLFVVYPAWGDYQRLSATIAGQEKELAALRAAPVPPPIPPGTIVTAQPSEPPRFLGLISRIAVGAGCRVIGFDLMPSGSAAPASDEPSAGPVKAVRARIELDATYPELREFLYRLSGASRPLTVTAVELSMPNQKDQLGTLHAAIDIERYLVTDAG